MADNIEQSVDAQQDAANVENKKNKKQDSNKPKRRPGRPSSKQPAPTLNMNGVVNEPDNPNNLIEFVLQEPSIFKTLFTYFKNLKSKDIHIRFAKDNITFFTRDYTLLSRVVAKIDCRNVNWYYCRKTIWVGLNRDKAEKIFTNIDKSLFKITIVYMEDKPEYLLFIFKDNELSKEMCYRTNISLLLPDEELFCVENEIPSEQEDDNSDLYPVQFTLSSKQFKKSISDASSYSDTIDIIKTIDKPLNLTYIASNIVYREKYMDPEKIKLISNLKENETFQRTVRLQNIKGLSSSIVTDTVSIMCSKKEDLLLKSIIDERKTMIVYTFVNCV
jgi:hypothetical protein